MSHSCCVTGFGLGWGCSFVALSLLLLRVAVVFGVWLEVVGGLLVASSAGFSTLVVILDGTQTWLPMQVVLPSSIFFERS